LNEAEEFYPQIAQIDTDLKTRREGQRRSILNTPVSSPSVL
jgi:hypothetical protein